MFHVRRCQASPMISRLKRHKAWLWLFCIRYRIGDLAVAPGITGAVSANFSRRALMHCETLDY